MKNIKKTSDDLDRLFKEGLNDFQVPLPSGKQEAEDDALDNLFKQELNNFEATPSQEVWDNVKTRIPLNLRMKRQLTWWTKVAAALIIGLTATVAIKEYQNSLITNEVVTKEKEVVPVIPIEADFVLELNKKENENTAKSSYEPSAQEMFSDEYEEAVAERDLNIEPIEQLEFKSEEVVVAKGNLLDSKQREATKHGDMPMVGLNEDKQEMLSQTDESSLKKEEDTAEKQQ